MTEQGKWLIPTMEDFHWIIEECNAEGIEIISVQISDVFRTEITVFDDPGVQEKMQELIGGSAIFHTSKRSPEMSWWSIRGDDERNGRTRFRVTGRNRVLVSAF